ncbi:radical SAM protein [Mycoplasmatota bacterium zrk1]
MIIKQNAKSLLIKSNGIESVFGNDFYMNIYRGCSHNCIYCDSRSSCYRVENFDKDVIVKDNAVELLEKELVSKRKKGVISLSGAMSDCYMHIEKKLEFTRGCLNILDKYNYPVMIHTKSDLVLRDIDILEKINNKTNANVLFTITTINDEHARIIEPNAPLPSKRFKAIKSLSDKGITTGIAIWPIIPFITDQEKNIIELIKYAHLAGCKYVIFGDALTLRGNQREYFYKKLDEAGSDLAKKYKRLYGDSYVCKSKNIEKIKKIIRDLCEECGLETKVSYYQVKEPSQISLF